MNPSRRHFLKQALALSVGLSGLRAAGGWSLLGCTAEAEGSGYGPLRADPARILDLPDRFRYHVISPIGQIMDDGLPVPGSHDGMAAFPGPDGLTVLVRNHELVPGQEGIGPFAGLDRDTIRRRGYAVYDRGTEVASPGSKTTLVYDTRERRLVRHFLSLTGTFKNCAGGPTPGTAGSPARRSAFPPGRVCSNLTATTSKFRRKPRSVWPLRFP